MDQNKNPELVEPSCEGRPPNSLCLLRFQMLGTLTALPIKVPQVSSLHRLAGQAATVLPQVNRVTLTFNWVKLVSDELLLLM